MRTGAAAAARVCTAMIRALSGGPPSAAGLQVAFQIRSLQSCGLFGNRDLRAPEDWSQAADEAVGRCVIYWASTPALGDITQND